MSFKTMISSNDPSFGESILKWLGKKSKGNPLIPSREKEQIEELEASEKEDKGMMKDEEMEMMEEKPKTSKRKTGFKGIA